MVLNFIVASLYTLILPTEQHAVDEVLQVSLRFWWVALAISFSFLPNILRSIHLLVVSVIQNVAQLEHFLEEFFQSNKFNPGFIHLIILTRSTIKILNIVLSAIAAFGWVRYLGARCLAQSKWRIWTFPILNFLPEFSIYRTAPRSSVKQIEIGPYSFMLSTYHIRIFYQMQHYEDKDKPTLADKPIGHETQAPDKIHNHEVWKQTS